MKERSYCGRPTRRDSSTKRESEQRVEHRLDVEQHQQEISFVESLVERRECLRFVSQRAIDVVFRLPDLPPGDWPLSIRLNGTFSANSPTLSIRAGP